MPKAKEAALKAVSLDGSLAEGHTSVAYVKLSDDWDLHAAEREFKRAIDLNLGYATAHHWYAHYFLAKGQLEKAIADPSHQQSRERPATRDQTSEDHERQHQWPRASLFQLMPSGRHTEREHGAG